MLQNILSVGLGGAIGAVLRYLLGLIPLKNNSGFPWITFVINVLGSFLIGIIAFSVLKSAPLSPRMVLFLKVGICGGFTTFSTFSLESYQLFSSGKIGIAVAYMLASFVCGILAVLCAAELVR